MLQFSLIAISLIIAQGILASDGINTVQLRLGEMYTELMNPEYPVTFTGDQSVSWRFESEVDSHVLMKCNDFRLTETENCDKVSLKIDDGQSSKSYCGNRHALKVVSKSNVLIIKFSGNANGHAAFSCIVKSTKAPTPELIEVNVGETSQLISPRKDSPYLVKEWHLKTSPEYLISFTCFINLKKASPCYEDVLTIDTGDGAKEYCSFDREDFFTKTNEATVRLELDKFGEGRLLCVARASIKQNEFNIMKTDRKIQIPEDSSEYGGKRGRMNTTCDCGWANKSKRRILRGNEAEPNEFPWMVALKVNFGKKTAGCGGSIVTHRHVLTAAHCVVNVYSTMKPVKTEDIDVIIGAHRLGTWPEWEPQTVVYASELHVHPEFLLKTTYDIAVIALAESIEFSKTVGPICLSENSLNIANASLTIMGWGKTERGTQSPVLLKAKTSIIDRVSCKVNPWEVCARADQRSTCSGDSGGPLVRHDPDTKRYTQVSLVSYGYPDCMSRPSVSTDVAYFYNWLQDVIKATYPNETTCTKVQ